MGNYTRNDLDSKTQKSQFFENTKVFLKSVYQGSWSLFLVGGNRQQQNSNAFSIILKVYTFSYIDTESLDVGVHISNILKSGHTNIFALFDYFELQINPTILASRNLDKYSELV